MSAGIESLKVYRIAIVLQIDNITTVFLSLLQLI